MSVNRDAAPQYGFQQMHVLHQQEGSACSILH